MRWGGRLTGGGTQTPPVLLVPYFEAGGRYTVNDVHYVAEGEQLIPAAETPFAKDAAFGYRNSNLRAWVEEKTGGSGEGGGGEKHFARRFARRRAGRGESETAVVARWRGLHRQRRRAARSGSAGMGGVAGGERGQPPDLSHGGEFCGGAARACAEGVVAACPSRSRSSGRESAPFRIGRSQSRLTSAATDGKGGLTIVGSYVPKTTTQLERLLANCDVERVEIPVEKILDAAQRGMVLRHAVEQANAGIRAGRDVVVFTSRTLVTGNGAEASLAIGNQVSEALVELLRGIEAKPRYLIAKGGITSSDLATRGLGVKRAMVLGQILPGVPVWELGAETKFPGLPYVVFPGNVGGPDALAEAVNKFNP